MDGRSPRTGSPAHIVFRDAAWPLRQLGAESAFRPARSPPERPPATQSRLSHRTSASGKLSFIKGQALMQKS